MPTPSDFPPSVTPSQPLPRTRRWLCVSLRGLMGFVLVIGSGLGYLVYRAKVQREAVAAIRETGGYILYDWQMAVEQDIPPHEPALVPTWLVRGLGPDFFGAVGWVRLGDNATDATMAQVGRLPQLKTLYVASPRVTDAGLANLTGLAELANLTIFQPSRLTGVGLVHLRGLNQLKFLGLGGIPIQDADLTALDSLANLRSVNLTGAAITDAGMVHLNGLVQLRWLELYDVTAITSAGLKPLAGLTELTDLNLTGTRVGNSGLSWLGAGLKLERLTLTRTMVTDAVVDQVQGWQRLRFLGLDGTAVTRDRRDRLHAARPDLVVDPQW